ncbi:MAG TPA: hypothetical protein VG079_07060 [Gaiellaceae bacterium]|nr:hypothetical protein [Gaiellaceae bacterium]
MNAAVSNDASARRGASRLLTHCARLAGGADDRPNARTRLEGELGLELARLLVDALASGPRRALV